MTSDGTQNLKGIKHKRKSEHSPRVIIITIMITSSSYCSINIRISISCISSITKLLRRLKIKQLDMYWRNLPFVPNA